MVNVFVALAVTAPLGSSGILGLILATIRMLLDLPMLTSFGDTEVDIIANRSANDAKTVTIDKDLHNRPKMTIR